MRAYFLCVTAIMIAILLQGCNSQTLTADRYIVLSPEIAEILAKLGVTDKIVGVTAECDFPTELQTLPKVGNFGQVSLEQIVALRPSIVFASSLEQASIASELAKLNIQTVEMYPHNLQDLMSIITELGSLCGKEDEAVELIEYMSSKNIQQSPPGYQEKRVYIEIYGDPIMSASDYSFVGSLLKYAGGENIFPTLVRDYARVNAEDVVRLNPEVIIITYPGVTAEDIYNRKGWGGVTAIKEKRVYTVEDINPDLILRAGPRNVEGVRELFRVIDN